MKKAEFLRRLSKALSPLERAERERTLAYYGEMIDDRLEAGADEETVISELEGVDEIAARLTEEAALRGETRKRARPLSTALIVLGSPLWLCLLICVAVVILCVYVVAWCLIITLLAIVASLAACGLAGAAGLFIYLGANTALAVFLFGAGIVCLGLCALALWPSWFCARELGKGTGRFCLRIWRGSVGKLRGAGR